MALTCSNPQSKACICGSMQPLTINQALVIQDGQIERWRMRLSPKCFKALVKEAQRRNKAAQKCGHHIWRGTDILEFILNW